jgi:hypothetical protein
MIKKLWAEFRKQIVIAVVMLMIGFGGSSFTWVIAKINAPTDNKKKIEANEDKIEELDETTVKKEEFESLKHKIKIDSISVNAKLDKVIELNKQTNQYLETLIDKL